MQQIDDNPALLEPLKMVCASLIADSHETGWSGYEAEGDHARFNGNWTVALNASARAVELLGQTTAQEGDLDMASLLKSWGYAFQATRHCRSRNCLSESADHLFSIGGPEDLRVADTLDLLAAALSDEPANPGLTGPLFFRAWAMRESVLGPEPLAVADSLHHLALSLHAEDLSMAMPLLHRAMIIRIRAFGHDDASVADSLNAMAHMPASTPRLGNSALSGGTDHT